MVQIALLPIAPILLMPFILLFFIIVFPIWLVAMVVLSIVYGIGWVIDAILKAMNVETRISGPIKNAFHWTLSWGGIANRRDRPAPVAEKTEGKGDFTAEGAEK
ncbi:MAG: hypothetical protein M3Z05_07160 [Gemmatimonadota bacterium]|nr:hypothetical protein [Gemmatimonadota bacterium]